MRRALLQRAPDANVPVSQRKQCFVVRHPPGVEFRFNQTPALFPQNPHGNLQNIYGISECEYITAPRYAQLPRTPLTTPAR